MAGFLSRRRRSSVPTPSYHLCTVQGCRIPAESFYDITPPRGATMRLRRCAGHIPTADMRAVLESVGIRTRVRPMVPLAAPIPCSVPVTP